MREPELMLEMVRYGELQRLTKRRINVKGLMRRLRRGYQ